MPSLEMKIKSTTGCLKEKNGLHVCRKSSMITKYPLSEAKAVQNAEKNGSCTQSCLDVSVYDKVNAQDLGRNEAIHDGLSNEAKQLPILTNSSTVDSWPREPTSSVSTPNMAMTFLPIVDSMNFHNSEGNDAFYLPQLNSNNSDDGNKSSCEKPACNVSDFYISDMIYSGSNSLFNNEMDAIFLPHYTWDDSHLLSQLTEEDMLLPFLEDTPEPGCDHQGRSSSEETIADTDVTIQQSRSYNPDSDVNAYLDLDYECFDPQMYIRNLLQSDMAFNLLTNENHNTKKITLVLDLDETLVHSTLEYCDDADFTFPVYFDMKEHTVYVKRRPHLETFLKRVADMFEIVVFTASQSIYADQLLDILDPDGNIISQRAYRESCIVSEGNYTKDLTVLGVDLAKVAIIDNSPQVFRLQVNNGIPIESWFNDPSDCELISLLPFLETLVDADDVRPIIARKFGNRE